MVHPMESHIDEAGLILIGWAKNFQILNQIINKALVLNHYGIQKTFWHLHKGICLLL